MTTAHQCASPRDEVSAAALDAVRLLVPAGGELGGVRIEVDPPGAGGVSFRLGVPGGGTLVECVLAHDAATSARWWGAALSAYRATGLDEVLVPLHALREPPGVPWLAVVILPEVVRHPALIPLLEDAERCVAWALVVELAP